MGPLYLSPSGCQRTALPMLPSQLDEASFECTCDGIRPGRHSELSVDRSQMGLNRVARDVESGGDLLIAARRQEPQDLQLCLGERLDQAARFDGAPLAIANRHGGFAQASYVRVLPHLRQMLDQIASHLSGQ